MIHFLSYLIYFGFMNNINCLSSSFSAGVIGCGYFHACRKFKIEISNLVKRLVPAARIVWQWTKVITYIIDYLIL